MAHVRYNQILTHSYTTLGLSCRFSTSGLIFFLLGGGGGPPHSLPWELRDNGVVKIFNFDPTSKPRNHVNFAINC